MPLEWRWLSLIISSRVGSSEVYIALQREVYTDENLDETLIKLKNIFFIDLYANMIIQKNISCFPEPLFLKKNPFEKK